MGRAKKFCVASIVCLVLIIAFLHYSTDYASPVHDIWAELHYLPVLIAALAFGLKGSALVSVLILVVYIPYLVATWTGTWLSSVEHSIHVLFPAFFGLPVGFLVDLERKQRHELEKSRYLAGLGQAGAALVHDLKNPVLTIRGFASRIERGKGDVQTSAKVIVEAAGRIEQVIESVLSFAKPIILEMREEDINVFIKEICENTKSKAEEYGVTVLAAVPGTELKAQIDRSFVERALVNLIANAIEASKAGQSVVVSASRDKGRIVIQVADKGKGMDRDTLENLFIPFYSRKPKGTGLGMAIAKKVIEEHGGQIKVTSRIGNGTDVWVELPIHPAP